MEYEVVVVGGGIGGLTAAALLAVRGVSVCVLERQSQVGGCVADFEHLGYRFDPTYGLYSGWEERGIFAQVFSELRSEPPRVQPLPHPYVVRLPDHTDVAVSNDEREFDTNLRQAFPECAESASGFYRELGQHAGSSANVPLSSMLTNCSFRFRRFLDIQLQTFAQRTSESCSASLGAVALNRHWWQIEGGAQALADSLAASVKHSGGAIRLDSPVLRLAYGSDAAPIGVDLLSGERLIATRAIVSNLTAWDTYGKLIGLSRTPAQLSSQLRGLHSWGAYLLFLGMDGAAAANFTSSRILALTDWQKDETYDPETAQLVLVAAPSSERAPQGKVAVTVSAFTNAADWFSFHEDHTAHEERDQKLLEQVWSRLHMAMPELGDRVEVIETATPQTFYESTRRKFGMIGRPQGPFVLPNAESWQTHLPNLFIISDSISSTPGVAGVAETAKSVAAEILG
jgi:phytoene dehydrogenase-like protein